MAIRRISVETETAIASTSKTIRKLILFKGAGLIAAKLHQSPRSRIAVAAVESSFPLILCHHVRPRVQFTAHKKLFSTITSTAAVLYGRALLSSSFISPYHPDYRLHNHLPPLPSEYAAGLIQPVLLHGPSSIYTREKVAGICPFLSSCPLAQCTAHSGTVIVYRWLIRILHSWVGRSAANGNRISSDHENGRNVADKMQTIYFWNNPKISTHWNFNSIIIIAITRERNFLCYFINEISIRTLIINHIYFVGNVNNRLSQGNNEK